MARPRKDAAEDSAKQRLHQAFWDELAQTPFAHMTVGRVVARAGVNRNTFYYHYSCLDALAQESVRGQLPRKVVDMVHASGLSPSILDEALTRELEPTLQRLCLAAGPQGSGILGDYLREEITSLWMGKFGLTQADLTQAELMAISFTTAGLVAMASMLVPGEELTNMQDYMSSSFFKNTSSSAIAMLADAQKRKEKTSRVNRA